MDFQLTQHPNSLLTDATLRRTKVVLSTCCGMTAKTVRVPMTLYRVHSRLGFSCAQLIVTSIILCSTSPWLRLDLWDPPWCDISVYDSTLHLSRIPVFHRVYLENDERFSTSRRQGKGRCKLENCVRWSLPRSSEELRYSEPDEMVGLRQESCVYFETDKILRARCTL